jgi:hypothetical protein
MGHGEDIVRTRWRERGKGQRAHQEAVGTLGKAGGGRERPYFAGKLSDVEDEFVASVASRLDSLNGDDTDDDGELQDASA